MVSEARQVLTPAVHFPLRAGSGNLRNQDWSIIQSLAEQTNTPFINLHIEPIAKDFPAIKLDDPTEKQYKKVIRNIIKDVSAAVEYFGAQRIIIENVPYRGPQGKALRIGVEPVILRQIVAETHCGLLLDISHARIAAHHLGLDSYEYMDSLPVQALRELHFTGLHHLNGNLQDHLEALPEDWPYLQWVLNRIQGGQWGQPWMLVYEYGGVGDKFDWRTDPHIIEEHVPRLYEMAHANETWPTGVHQQTS
jgi:uncharacterized protein (UPF0276 family)